MRSSTPPRRRTRTTPEKSSRQDSSMKIGKCSVLAAVLLLGAQQPAKRIPADGIAVPAADRADLEAALAHLQASCARLKSNPLLADVLIFSEAVRYALQYNEFFKPGEIAAAKKLLQEGEERAAQLAAGQSRSEERRVGKECRSR